MKFCKLDIPKFCKDIPKGEGKTIECLKKNYEVRLLCLAIRGKNCNFVARTCTYISTADISFLIFFLFNGCVPSILDYEQSLFLLRPSIKTPERRKWPRAWLRARDGRGTKKRDYPQSQREWSLTVKCFFGVKTEVLTGQARETWP